MFSCSLNVPEINLKSRAESRYLSGSYLILLGNDPENGNYPCTKHIFVLSFQLHGICEIRCEVLLVTGYMSDKSGEGLVLDFGAHLIHFIVFFMLEVS